MNKKIIFIISHVKCLNYLNINIIYLTFLKRNHLKVPHPEY